MKTKSVRLDKETQTAIAVLAKNNINVSGLMRRLIVEFAKKRGFAKTGSK